jgi:hypothetical protein
MSTIGSKIVCLAVSLLWAWGGLSLAQEVPPPDAAPAAPPEEAEGAAAKSSGGALSDRQRQVRERFVELERLLLRMAELTAPTDPQRAALLRRAVSQSKQRDIDHQFEELVKLLHEQQLSMAVRGQGEVQRELARLLDLLLSEDRGKRIESEKERIRAYLKRVNKIIKDQKSIQGETNRQGDTDDLAERQGELSEQTGELADDVKQEQAQKEPLADESKSEREQPGQKKDEKNNDEKKGDDEADEQKGDDSKSKPGENSDSKPGEQQKPGDEKSGEPMDSEKSDGQSKPGKPQDQPPMPGEPMPGQSPSEESQESPPANENPAQQRLEKAQQRMQQAQEKLKEAEREQADEKQAEALRELEQAKAELEEILRQLREEEMARMLAMLEARFRKMLDAQVQVYEGTVRVDQVPKEQRDRDDEIEAGRLSRAEAAIVIEADKCLSLLREEGSAVAFPEAVVEMRDDMQQVVDRLAEANVGSLTQSVETDIMTALEEMIAALKKAQKDMENQQQQQGQPGQGAPGEPPLVDTLAELRMIRALQMRVNNRTQAYSKLIQAEQADTPELLEALKKLAEREERIHAVTRDIVVGRNQ